MHGSINTFNLFNKSNSSFGSISDQLCFGSKRSFLLSHRQGHLQFAGRPHLVILTAQFQTDIQSLGSFSLIPESRPLWPPFWNFENWLDLESSRYLLWWEVWFNGIIPKRKSDGFGYHFNVHRISSAFKLYSVRAQIVLHLRYAAGYNFSVHFNFGV